MSFFPFGNPFSGVLSGRLLPPVVAGLTLTLGGCRPNRPAAVPNAPKPPEAVKSTAGWFRDVTAEAGITYRWPELNRSPLTNVETFGAGCAFLDADSDGWLDVLLVGSPACALYLNRGDGTFRDATAESGLAQVRGNWSGCAVGDINGDARPDLLLTGLNSLKLLEAESGPRFQDVTDRAGIKPGGWASSAGFMDLDGDEDLDLVVGQYLELDPYAPRYCELRPGVFSSCTPERYAPQFPRLFRNNGNATFTDVTGDTGLHRSGGKNLALGFTDFDRDGRMDFFFANDGTPGDLFRNLGRLRFENVGLVKGVAMGVSGGPQAGMGVDWGDYDRDGRQDLAVTAFSDEAYSIYRQREADFEQISTQVGIGQPTYQPLGFGVKWLDLDNDGWLDLAFSNGHIHDNVHRIDNRLTFRQPLQLFANREGRKFEEVSVQAGSDATRPIVGRGLATGDYDRDGRIDLLAVDFGGAPLLLRNEKPAGNWLEIELRQPGPNPFAYGARVTVEMPQGGLVREVSPASSFLSSSSPGVHLGLGKGRTVRGKIEWPDGASESFRTDEVNRFLRVARRRKVSG